MELKKKLEQLLRKYEEGCLKKSLVKFLKEFPDKFLWKFKRNFWAPH